MGKRHHRSADGGPLAPAITNAFTVDVEDYFQVAAFAPYISRAQWGEKECRVERNVDRILQMLDDCGVKATFFILGWIADRYPQVVQRIVDNGHEPASHGYGHERASNQDQAAFFADIQLAKIVLEDAAGQEVKGYRAPSFSIGKSNLWAFDCLERAGYRYSSSIYPVRHDHYGMPDGRRFPHRVHNLLELPPTTLRLANRNWPASGGGYFRLLPYQLSRWMLRRVNQEEGKAAIFYFHPWEIDPDQPRIPGLDARASFRHYVNLARMEGRLRRLLADFKWGRMDRIYLDPLGKQPC